LGSRKKLRRSFRLISSIPIVIRRFVVYLPTRAPKIVSTRSRLLRMSTLLKARMRSVMARRGVTLAVSKRSKSPQRSSLYR